MTFLNAVIIEDNPAMGELYQQLLKQLGYQVNWFTSGGEGIEAIANNSVDLLLLDLELPDTHGFQILEKVKQRHPDVEVVVITGHSSVESAVQSIQMGADDFIQKPFGMERLKTTLDNLMKKRHLSKELKVLRDEVQRNEYAGFVGGSLSMQVVYRIIDSAAASKASVFITGESGTGKELCAQAIHEHSDRAGKPFIAVNCGAIPKELFESEIFGHVKGSFSGALVDRTGAAERADGGTLFLDEICEMQMDQQVKLLRLIQSNEVQPVGSNQTRKVNVRFLCATNKDPLSMVQKGLFREDLYYRLNVIPITLPPLRDRGDDVIQIAQHMLKQFSTLERKHFLQFSDEASQAIKSQHWPGNVRQLANVIHNIVLMNDSDQVELAMLPPYVEERPQHTAEETLHQSMVSEHSKSAQLMPLWKVEKLAIERAITHCKGNVPIAAAHLGISASTIYRKKKQWECNPPEK